AGAGAPEPCRRPARLRHPRRRRAQPLDHCADDRLHPGPLPRGRRCRGRRGRGGPAAVSAPWKDHFSEHAAAYAAYRPTYPAALFEVLAALPRRRALALDCATGNGQAAVGLAELFERVVAIDASSQQLASARPHPRIEYRVARAEQTGVAGASVDLVSV